MNKARRSFRLTLLLGVGWAVGPATAGADAAGPAPLQASITAVTVYADRARVTREAAVELPAGTLTVAFAKLPGWIDEESVRLALTPADAAEVADVRIQREFLARTTDQELRQAEKTVTDIADRLAALDDEKQTLEVMAKHLENIRVFALDKMPRDAALEGIKIGDYAATVGFISSNLTTVAVARRSLEQRRRELQPELGARQRALSDLQTRRRLEQCTVVVSLRAPQARKATLILTCLMPGAGWEPLHELRAAGPAPEQVAVTSYAVVSQTAGEDWNGAALTFSTQSPADILQLPEPDQVLLEGRPAPQLVGVKAAVSSFSIAAKNYAEQNMDWNRLNNNPVGLEEVQRLSTLNGRINRLFAELSLRGTTSHFAGEGRPLVRADGRPVRVVIGRADVKTQPGILAVPAKTLNAVHTIALTNTTGRPLLPGRVALFEGGAFLGYTDMKFVAEGEAFQLALGMADSIKLARVLDQKKSALVRGSRTRIQAAFVIGVENLSRQPAGVRLLDRVPVSQDREIKVYGVDIEPKAVPDPKGLLEWKFVLAPGEKKELHLEYTLEYPVNYLQTPAPAAGANHEMQRQIQDLEAKF
ncbi:MAG: mucoidy inhibitor MuiA family protein [Kiritimatiellaeota bacterium]|nr:mucoidy inhibitor MuiA family protein [Kiritimatiellota bacterium]